MPRHSSRSLLSSRYLEPLVEAEPVGDLTLKGIAKLVTAFNVVGVKAR